MISIVETFLLERIKPYVDFPIPLIMKGKLANSIFLITLLLGILASSAALGSHLNISPTSSGPPPIHQPQGTQKRINPIRKTPVSLPAPSTNPAAPSLTKSRFAPEQAGKKKQSEQSHSSLGWRFLLNGQIQPALAAYRQALRHNPHYAIAYLGLGISLKNLGEVELAKKALGKAVDLDPHLPSALVHLGYLYAEGHNGAPDLTTAHRLFKKAAQLGDPFAAIALLDLQSGSKL